MNLYLGSWAFPLAVTILLVGGVFIWDRQQPPATGYGAAGNGIIAFMALLLAAIGSLIVWLIWALTR